MAAPAGSGPAEEAGSFWEDRKPGLYWKESLTARRTVNKTVFQGCWLCRHPWRAVWREAVRAPSQESWCIRKQTGSSWATAHQPPGPSPGCGRPEPQGSRRACAGLELTSLFAQVSVGTASFPGFYCFSSAVTKIHCAAQSASSLCFNIYI